MVGPEVKHVVCRMNTHYTLDIGNVPHSQMYPAHSDHKETEKMVSHTHQVSEPPATFVRDRVIDMRGKRRTC